MRIFNNLVFASVFTLVLLFSMVGFFVILAFFLTGALSLIFAIAFIILFNFILFFISPILMDLMLRFLYKSEEVKLDAFISRIGRPAEVIHRVMAEKKYINIRNVYIINDNTPTAFTYGSLPSEARLAVSRGLLEMLNEDEIEIVLAHELGHIANLDFIIMTIAQTIVEIFYVIYTSLLKSAKSGAQSSRGSKKGGGILFILLFAILAYSFYVISRYVVLYLSRVREYYADEFAVKHTRKPKSLAMALIKIAYGLGIAPPEQWNKFKGLEALCISSPTSFVIKPSNNPDDFIKYTDFDFKSPWASLVELDATHPLIGKRVKRIYEVGIEMGLIDRLPKDIANVKEHVVKANPAVIGLYILAMPLFIVCAYILSFIIGLVGVFAAGAVGAGIALMILAGAVGISIIAKGILQFLRYADRNEHQLEELLMDETASPVQGKALSIEGTALGRGEAGFLLSTDLYVRTKENVFLLVKTGFAIPILNFVIGILRIFRMEKLLGQDVRIKGWFFRGNGYWIDGDKIEFKIGDKWENLMGIGAIINGLLYLVTGGFVMVLALFAPLLLLVL
ncbi:MAG: M48 family metalloprotease [Candidatus Micrarchaeia archaeon]